MMLIQCCMLVQKQLNLNFELNQKRKNLVKIKKTRWKFIIEMEIKTMRGQVLILTETERNKDPKRRKARMVIRKYKITSAINIPTIKEELKQKRQVKAQRERRFDKRNKFYRQNKIFQTDAKIVYRETGKNHVTVKETPPKDGIEKFWKGI